MILDQAEQVLKENRLREVLPRLVYHVESAYRIRGESGWTAWYNGSGALNGRLAQGLRIMIVSVDPPDFDRSYNWDDLRSLNWEAFYSGDGGEIILSCNVESSAALL